MTTMQKPAGDLVIRGKRARNFIEIPAEQIADIKVLLTVVGGRIVHQSGNK